MNVSTDSGQATASLLRELRDRDSETGLSTANRIRQVLFDEIARSERYGNPLSCILVQVHGLNAARNDARLRLGSRLADVMRKTDDAAVWRDETFLLVLPETDQTGVKGFANKLEQALTDLAFELKADGQVDVVVATRATTWKTGDDVDGILGRLVSASWS